MAGRGLTERRAQFKRYKEDVESEGKAFFPHAMFNDTVMSLVVVEHGVREERLALRLDVLLVALELRAAFGEPAAGHQRTSPFPRAAGRTSPSRPVSGGGFRSRPAAPLDHGGEVTPSRTTR